MTSETQWTALDYQFMGRAIQLAKRGLYSTSPNPRVGCVLVKHGKQIAEGWHEKAGEAHAEVMAIKNATETPEGASCYVSLEPCQHYGKTPPCSEAIIAAGMSRVIAAVSDPNPDVAGNGLKHLQSHGIETASGLMSDEATAVNRGFFKRMQSGLPYVRLKLGTSLDGKIALANGQSQWITSTAARQDVQHLRAASCAIITGVNTLLADDPALTVREVDTLGRQPLRIILDSSLRSPLDARMYALPGKTLIYTCSSDTTSIEKLRSSAVEVISVEAEKNQVSINEVLKHLASQHQVNEVLVEAGPAVAGSFIEQQRVDEMILYQSAKILGNTGIDMLNLTERKCLDEVHQATLIDSRQVGSDMRFTYKFT